MVEPLWVTKRDALAIHSASLAEHGGLPGIRDEGLLESALGRPENLNVYGAPDLADLAAACAFGLAKNHPFIDGNKRTSLGVCLTFLDANGLTLPVGDEETIAVWMAVADGSMSEANVAAWLRLRLREFTMDISGEGEIVQRDLIERGPIPTVHADGWIFECIVDGMGQVVLYTNHTRDDGQIVRVVQGRLVARLDVWEDTMRKIDKVIRK